MRQSKFALFLITFFFLLIAILSAQNQAAVDSSLPLPPHEKKIHLKHVLVIGQTKGFEHDSVPDGMAAIYSMGRESGLWDTTLRTDTELITKKDLQRNTKNLDYFDALVFVSTTGELDLDDSQKADMLSFIKRRWQGFRRCPRCAGHQLQVARVRGDDRWLVRPASLDDVQCAHY